MRKQIALPFMLTVAIVSTVHCGFLGAPVGYSAGFAGSSAIPFATPPPRAHFAAATYSAPLPVAPISVNTYSSSSHHTYAAPPPPVVKYHARFNPFRTYTAKFAPTRHIPAVYNSEAWDAPNAVVKFAASAEGYNGWDSQNAVVKFASPSEEYGGGWDSPNAVVKFAAPAEEYDGGWDSPNAVVKFSSPVAPVTYSGWDAPRTVVKFGQPVTTTTTSFAAPPHVATYAASPHGVTYSAPPHTYAAPFRGALGW